MKKREDPLIVAKSLARIRLVPWFCRDCCLRSYYLALAVSPATEATSIAKQCNCTCASTSTLVALSSNSPTAHQCAEHRQRRKPSAPAGCPFLPSRYDDNMEQLENSVRSSSRKRADRTSKTYRVISHCPRPIYKFNTYSNLFAVRAGHDEEIRTPASKQDHVAREDSWLERDIRITTQCASETISYPATTNAVKIYRTIL